MADHGFRTELCAHTHVPGCSETLVVCMQKRYLAGSGSLLLLAQHKSLPGAEAVLKGVVVPQGSCLPQLQLQTTDDKQQ